MYTANTYAHERQGMHGVGTNQGWNQGAGAAYVGHMGHTVPAGQGYGVGSLNSSVVQPPVRPSAVAASANLGAAALHTAQQTSSSTGAAGGQHYQGPTTGCTNSGNGAMQAAPAKYYDAVNRWVPCDLLRGTAAYYVALHDENSSLSLNPFTFELNNQTLLRAGSRAGQAHNSPADITQNIALLEN